VNPGYVGFYRVKYPLEMLSTFVRPIREKTISAVDRLSLLDDQFALLQTGMGQTTEVRFIPA